MSSNASLDALLADAVASDYESANADRHTSRSIKSLAVICALILALLFSAAVVTKNQQQKQNNAIRQALIDRVKIADQRVGQSEKDATTAQQDLADAESAHLAGTDLGAQAQQRLDALRKITGLTPLRGGGVEVLMNDAPANSSIPNGSIIPGKVQDHDIQAVVNGLWTAGAKGIAINGRRLSATSAIRNAGDAILVNYRPLVPPYHIVAVSNNADLTAGTFRDGVAGLLLEELAAKYGVIWSLTMLGQTTIPAAPSVTSNQGGN